jgi:photosystem II stability/assembly factor-like uncharacterized protein
MTSPHDDFDLDALLRRPVERLAPPDGSWEQVSRRARRRKWAKASAGVTAALIIVAGAVPAVIAVRHSSNDQTIVIGNGHGPQQKQQATTLKTPGPAPSSAPAAIAPSITGFFPDSVSFISQKDGYAWGSIGKSRLGAIAHTTDGGTKWVGLPAPKVDNSFVTDSADSDGQIRFGFDNTGFVYGAKYFVTSDGGETWTQFASPGYIDDLETMGTEVWALVRPSKDASTVSLYSASVSEPALQPVTAVSNIADIAGADSLALNRNTSTQEISVDVIAGSAAFFTSPDGVTWHQHTSPCPATVGGGHVQNALVSTLNLGTVAAACGYNVGAGSEDKQVYLSTNNGKTWTITAANPSPSGYLQTFAAGTKRNMIIGTARGGAQVTHDGGATWQADVPPGNLQLSFVGFIDIKRIVGVVDRGDATSLGAFALSNNSGRSWTVHQFPN